MKPTLPTVFQLLGQKLLLSLRADHILEVLRRSWKQRLATNRIYHWSPMQTEKSQPEGKRIMPETRFTEFPTLSIDSRVGIVSSALETDDLLFLPVTSKIIIHHSSFLLFLTVYVAKRPSPNVIRSFSL